MADDHLYSGFLGAEATRFIGQSTTDIHVTAIDSPVRVRQRATAFAPGLTVIYAEVAPNGGPINANTVWIPWPPALDALQVVNNGPSQPLNLPWLGPVVQAPFIANVNGGPKVVHGIPWFFELDERHVDPQNMNNLRTLHHYEHTKHRSHHITPKFVVNGKHKEVARLRFGTQLQVYRRGELD